MSVQSVGAMCFGLVVGWITYRTLRRREGNAALSDIASVLAAIGGGTVTSLFHQSEIFSWYAIGLTAGFFLYLIIGWIVGGKQNVDSWMKD